VVAGVPYTGVEVHTSQQTLANGNTIQHQESANVSRDSMGRVRRETTSQRPDGTTESRVSISDPVAGKVYELDVKHKVAFERPAHFPPAATSANASRRGPAPRTRPTDPNVKSEALASKTLSGVFATGTRITHTMPAGTIGNAQAIESTHETWMSEDLKVPVMTTSTDPRTGTRTMQLTNINRAEPDATLFTVPSDYTVRKGGPGGPGGPRPGRGPGGPGGPGGPPRQ
jgi:hypothetical protein